MGDFTAMYRSWKCLRAWAMQSTRVMRSGVASGTGIRRTTLYQCVEPRIGIGL